MAKIVAALTPAALLLMGCPHDLSRTPADGGHVTQDGAADGPRADGSVKPRDRGAAAFLAAWTDYRQANGNVYMTLVQP